MAAALAGLNELFARVWFGNAPAGLKEYQSARKCWEQLEALTSQ
jgi:hypothetical protein